MMRTLVATSLILLLVTVSQAQQRRELEQPTRCDSAASFLDFAVIDTKAAPNTYLVILARLGKGEPSRLNRIRLVNAEEYVLRRGTDLKYLLATGNRTNGLGRLELYVAGRLHRVMPFEKNAKGHCLPGREGW